MNKITDKELQELKSLNTKISNLKSTIADCTVQIARASMLREDSVKMVQQEADKLEALQIELEKSYGNVVINLQTGEYRDGDS
jgi:septal ring factor EnvC (AmiA/AmiB activator)